MIFSFCTSNELFLPYVVGENFEIRLFMLKFTKKSASIGWLSFPEVGTAKKGSGIYRNIFFLNATN